jgi:hypothetical protein
VHPDLVNFGGRRARRSCIITALGSKWCRFPTFAVGNFPTEQRKDNMSEGAAGGAKPGAKGGDASDARRGAAVLIALRAGLLKKCPSHGEVYDPGQHDYQGACMMAAFMINRDDPLVAPFGGDRTPLTELLKSICTPYPPQCPLCANGTG